MKISISVLAVCFCFVTSRLLGAAGPGGLPRNSPEAQGVSSAAILGFIEAADKQIDSLHSFMMLRRGEVIAEGWWAPYAPDSPHVMFSLSKSFTSTAVGMAIAEGKFSVDDEVVKFFPDDAPSDASRNLKAMRVRDLLRMNTGHETEPPRPEDKSWIKAFLEHPVKFKPGTHFLYNTSASYILAAIVEKTTGMSLLDFLGPRVLAPIGIEKATWDKSPEGITLGGYGLNLRTEDIARFGQLYLRRGKWHTKQLIPAEWIDEATSFQTSNGSNPISDWDQGYGYQFWRSRNHSYRGDGAFGQYCLVLPKEEVVIAITSGLGNMQAVLDLVWEKILPGIKAETLPQDSQNQTKLTEAMKKLSLPTQTASAEGKGTTRQYRFPENRKKLETISLQKNPDGSTTIVAKIDGVESRIICGRGEWKKTEALWNTGPLTGGSKVHRIAASGGWTADDAFTAKLCFYETPFVHRLTLKFSGDELRVNNEANVGFGPAKEPELIGRAE
ncbi:MAG: serine hydrolase domain-containing protein [Limisphaerales bacterium]